MGNILRTYYKSPIGLIEIKANEESITSIRFTEEKEAGGSSSPLLEKTIEELVEYFNGNRKTFSVKLKPEGTEFQKRVWDELVKIPFGRTVTYGDIADVVGGASTVRAVGTANGRNPIWLLIPCHRVIGTKGELTGYAGGIWRKKWLLEHEAKFEYGEQFGLFK